MENMDEMWNDMENMEERQVEMWNDMENTEENCENIWKIHAVLSLHTQGYIPYGSVIPHK
jgi:hypothetical protein